MSRFFQSIFPRSLFLATTAFGQTNNSFDIRLEVQAYPTGVIPSIHLEWGLSSQDILLTRVGYNIVRHRDPGA